MLYINLFIALTIFGCAFGSGIMMSNYVKSTIKQIGKMGKIKDNYNNLPCKPIPQNHWCINNRCIAHSLGEVNGSVYTNSLEALNNSVKRGFRVFETDVSYTSDDVPVLWHQLGDEKIGDFDKFSHSKFDYRYTQMSLEDLLMYMSKRSDLYFLIDSKRFESYRVSCSIKEIIEHKMPENKDIYNRLIIQISSEDEYYQIEKLKLFKYYHYIFAQEKTILERLPFLITNNIHTVSVRINIVNPEHIKLLKQKGIYAYVYAPYLYELDHLKAIERYIKSGVYGAFSHSITDKDLRVIPEMLD